MLKHTIAFEYSKKLSFADSLHFVLSSLFPEKKASSSEEKKAASTSNESDGRRKGSILFSFLFPNMYCVDMRFPFFFC